ncbi:hypothetical protein HYFRA_00001585 [Hymenoscyphus fraxineus]|uniref:Uncharacterized protein n=1 Tax=Hymenoscyphus fraxineus TaxID=746836 RepID=A0A9N9L3N1_9HELO|nr:hypothetical protein HYFRA_00001585 [Hymenoscyphus fraxineus]
MTSDHGLSNEITCNDFRSALRRRGVWVEDSTRIPVTRALFEAAQRQGDQGHMWSLNEVIRECRHTTRLQMLQTRLDRIIYRQADKLWTSMPKPDPRVPLVQIGQQPLKSPTVLPKRPAALPVQKSVPPVCQKPIVLALPAPMIEPLLPVLKETAPTIKQMPLLLAQEPKIEPISKPVLPVHPEPLPPN